MDEFRVTVESLELSSACILFTSTAYTGWGVACMGGDGARLE